MIANLRRAGVPDKPPVDYASLTQDDLLVNPRLSKQFLRFVINELNSTDPLPGELFNNSFVAYHFRFGYFGVFPACFTLLCVSPGLFARRLVPFSLCPFSDRVSFANGVLQIPWNNVCEPDEAVLNEVWKLNERSPAFRSHVFLHDRFGQPPHVGC